MHGACIRSLCSCKCWGMALEPVPRTMNCALLNCRSGANFFFFFNDSLHGRVLIDAFPVSASRVYERSLLTRDGAATAFQLRTASYFLTRAALFGKIHRQ
jgi:hypothetical protein